MRPENIGATMGTWAKRRQPTAGPMSAGFADACSNEIVSQPAKYRYMADGQASLSETIRLAKSACGFVSWHSQTVENRLLDCPGLEVAGSGSPSDVDGPVRAAIRHEDQVPAGA